ncbi:TonB family protein [Candidatus Saganbacteria bacterium]|nr:TonB family protein [Candidatus Saganbacteria bacterium]
MYTKVNSFKSFNWSLAVFLAAVAVFAVARIPITSHRVASLNISADTPIIKVQAPAITIAKTKIVPLAQATVQPVVQPMLPPAQSLPIVPPTVTFKVLPQYPFNVLQAETTGVVLLSVLVGLNGLPEAVNVKTSSGVAALDQAAVTALKQWRFASASQGGGALASWYEIPIKFEIN